MKFFKIVNSDLKNGFKYNKKKYLITALLFCFFCLQFFLERRIVEYLNPDILSSKASLGDYLFYIFVGNSNFEFSGILSERITFTLPTSWLIMILWLLYMTLNYPYKDLMGIGKHILVLSHKRSYWWFSKCIWVTTSVLLYYIIGLSSAILCSFLFGATPTLNISNYVPYDFIDYDHSLMNGPPWQPLGLLLVEMPFVCIALSLVQLLLSLLMKPFYSYIILVLYLIICSYFNSPFLLANYSMAARSELYISSGLSLITGGVFSFWIISIVLLIGLLLFNRLDIINRE